MFKRNFPEVVRNISCLRVRLHFGRQSSQQGADCYRNCKGHPNAPLVKQSFLEMRHANQDIPIPAIQHQQKVEDVMEKLFQVKACFSNRKGFERLKEFRGKWGHFFFDKMKLMHKYDHNAACSDQIGVNASLGEHALFVLKSINNDHAKRDNNAQKGGNPNSRAHHIPLNSWMDHYLA